MHCSPLRYPGGKSAIQHWMTEIILHNNLQKGFYAEPYAGGAGLALSLLLKKIVKNVYLNDLDRSIWSFWDSVLNNTDKLINKIRSTDITIDEWYKQKNIQTNKTNVDPLDLGFSTFFLNRTNRSGIIIKAGPIGGYKQNSDYKIDCRFNKEVLIKRIENIAEHKNHIHLSMLDAVDFISYLEKQLFRKKGLIYIDPPYYEQGANLYTNFYNKEDHSILAKKILKLKKSWVMTYDNNNSIQNLYRKRKQYNFSLNYSVKNKRKGTELLITNSNISIPNNLLETIFTFLI